MRVLDGVNARSLAGFGWESCAWVRCTGFADGGLPMGSIPGSARVMGDLMGRHFGWVVDFFLGGEGEGKRNSRARNAETMRRCFAGRCEFRTAPVCMLYIICWAAEVSLHHASGHLEKCPRPRCPGQRTCAVQASTTRRPVYASIYVKGLLLLVPPPRSCVYVAYAHAFYVVMCYMSITCICQLYVLKC